MPWKKHTRKTYYYRKRRLDGRVINEYLGRTREAALAAMSDAERAAYRADQRVQLQQYDELTQLVREGEDALQVLITAHMLVNGYHLHKRQWRKTRVQKNPNPPTR